MKVFYFAVVVAVLVTACGGMAHRDMPRGHGHTEMVSEHGMMGSMMKNMDTNGDGMLSKEEFMKGHETMFDRMKGPNGMISLKDMQTKGTDMMDQDGTMGGNHAAPGMHKGTR